MTMNEHMMASPTWVVVWIGRFVKVAIPIIFISLFFDYTDVIRYVLGDRAVLNGYYPVNLIGRMKVS